MKLVVSQDVEKFEAAQKIKELLDCALIMKNHGQRRVYLTERITVIDKNGKPSSRYPYKELVGHVKPHPVREGNEPFIVEWTERALSKFPYLSSLELWGEMKTDIRDNRECKYTCYLSRHSTVSINGCYTDPEATNLAAGATFTLDYLARECGLHQVILDSFNGNKNRANKAFSLAMMQVITGKDTFSDVDIFMSNHLVPCKSFDAPAATKFLKTIGSEQRMILLSGLQNINQDRVDIGNNYCLSIVNLDSTSITSLCKTQDTAYGKNKDGTNDPQINVAIIEHNGFPVFYKAYFGNVPDIATIQTIIRECKLLYLDSSLLFVTDKGYDSLLNQGFFAQMEFDFLCNQRLDTALSKNLIEEHFDELIRGFRHFHKEDDSYYLCVNAQIDLPKDLEHIRAHDVQGCVDGLANKNSNHERCMKQDVFAHLICNYNLLEDALSEIKIKTRDIEFRLNSDKKLNEQEEAFKQEYLIIDVLDNGYQICQPNIPAQRRFLASRSLRILLSNVLQDPILANVLYTNREAVEDCFKSMNCINGAERVRVQNALLEGKLYISFIATYLSRLFSLRVRHAIRDGLLPNKSIHSFYEILDNVRCSKPVNNHNTYIYNDISNEAKDVFNALKVPMIALD